MHPSAPENPVMTLHRLAAMATDLASNYEVRKELSFDAPTAPLLQRVLRARRARAEHFPADLFADPAWDMLLDLYHAHLVQQRVTVSSLCVAANVPATTALRYIQALEQKQLVERHPDPLDKRRFFVGLTRSSVDSFERYFTRFPVDTAR
jgi:DNA-binding MarR family transcriptional regulator